MGQEENIRQELIKEFNYAPEQVRVQRQRRIFADAAAGNFLSVLEFAVKKLQFVILCALTGLDEGENLGFIYHLAREDGIVLSIKIVVPKNNPVIKTITSYFPSAMIYEKEVIDLLGAKVEGVPDGPRYPLPDSWPVDQFPLRKDWNPDSLNKKEQKNA
ncbi:MAG: NADH-quinone oxidoreductase subunit C [Candidatus Omnitrophica bacterium]|nr:NADH-quinone oxidoreductase subunit C [Candidatus Omnitrophota bacterium]